MVWNRIESMNREDGNTLCWFSNPVVIWDFLVIDLLLESHLMSALRLWLAWKVIKHVSADTIPRRLRRDYQQGCTSKDKYPLNFSTNQSLIISWPKTTVCSKGWRFKTVLPHWDYMGFTLLSLWAVGINLARTAKTPSIIRRKKKKKEVWEPISTIPYR